jgi:membrane fusion protein (multidrug efflux system)
MSKVLRIFLVLVILAAAGWYGLNYWQEKQGEASAAAPAAGAMGTAPPVSVVTEIAKAQNLDLSISAVGSLISGESAEIHAEIAGQIEKISFEEGQPVKEGDVLLQIDKSLIETEYSKAKAAYDAAAATFERNDKLKESGYVSNQKWDIFRSDMQTAKSAVENARIRISKASIRAPFSGIAGLRSFSVGDYAQTGQALTTINSIDPLKVEFSVPEKNYSDIKVAQKIHFTVDAWPKESFEGEIYAIDPSVDPQTRNFKVKATIPNPETRLRPGMYARIDVATVTKPNVILIAEEAVMPQGNDNFVYTVENGQATMKKIVLGIREKGQVEVTEGLTEGTEIVTAGVMKLREGAKVVSESAKPAPTEE